MSQPVDSGSIKEFTKEIFSKISIETVEAMTADLQRKSDAFGRLLASDRVDALGEEQFKKLLKWIFSTRRHSDKVLGVVPIEKLRDEVAALLYGEGHVHDRFQHFYDALDGIPEQLRIDMAGELLHFTFPTQHWLWSRWLWDRKNKTGALRLLITDDFELEADSIAESYLKVGKATLFVYKMGEAAGYQDSDKSLFGTVVFMSAVYVIYTYTVLRMRMTQEFNKVVPGLEEFSRRILGIHRMEEYQID